MIDNKYFNLFSAYKLKDEYFLDVMKKELIDNFANFAVEFGTITNKSSSTTFGVFMMPIDEEPVDLQHPLSMIVYFDKFALAKTLTIDGFNMLLKEISKAMLNANYEYALNGKNCNSNAEYLSFYLSINLKLLKSIKDNDTKGLFRDFFARINFETMQRMIDLLNSETDYNFVLEEIKISNTVPADVLAYTRKFLSVTELVGDSKLERDRYFKQLLHISTNTTHPFMSRKIEEE